MRHYVYEVSEKALRLVDVFFIEVCELLREGVENPH